MKKIIILSIMALGLLSCSKELDTTPTDATTPEEVFTTVEGAFAAVNGIYRSLYMADWSEGYGTENFGVASVNLASDIMGEDLMPREPGSAWFWYDYRYWVRAEISNKSDRPFVWWNMYYKTVNNANYVIANAPQATGDPNDRNNVMAQAYALRAYAYFYLVQFYQRTYIGHENDPGVPLYDQPTDKTTQGKPRGTLTQAYAQINSDLDKAITLFKSASGQRHKSHIDIYVSYGLKARVALVQNQWQTALDNAQLAQTKPGMRLMGSGDLTSGFNSIANTEWMWGAEVIEAQATSWFSFFNHIDAAAGGHANSSRKIVANWLYDQIGENDVRKQWFKAPTGLPKNEEPALGPEVSYNQLKFRVKAVGSWASDYIYMRGAEMYLIEAEALCFLARYSEAREALLRVVSYKDPDYAQRLAAVPDGNTISFTSTGELTTLMDEILLQRRIELWGEGFRVLDIIRLKTGFDRTWAGSNHPVRFAEPADSWEFVMMIPSTEFEGNKSLDPATDQNE